MILGDFYYNEKHSNEPIQTEDDNGLCHWIFYLQPKWYEKTRFIIPDGTLLSNNIVENSVIFCIRKEGVDSKPEEKEEESETYEFQ